MLEAAVAWLGVRPGGVYVDCTAGAGGHSERIARQLTTGKLISLDRDPEAVVLAGRRLAQLPQARVVHANYADLAQVLASEQIPAADGVLIDAGMSSMQMDTPERGFSFQQDGPLDMRMDTSRGPSAAEYLAHATDDELVGILRTYGDIAPARRISKAILERARGGRMNTTADLTLAVQESLNCLKRMPDEVRTVFQAIRIAVNDELRWLERGVIAAMDVLAPGGRLVVISFHSGEDRIVKNLMRDASKPKRTLEADGRLRSVEPARYGLLTPKPVQPTEEEMRENSRAHSARLRALEKLK